MTHRRPSMKLLCVALLIILGSASAAGNEQDTVGFRASLGLGGFLDSFAEHLDAAGAWQWSPHASLSIRMPVYGSFGLQFTLANFAVIHPRSQAPEGVARFAGLGPSLALPLHWIGLPLRLVMAAEAGFMDPGFFLEPYASGYLRGRIGLDIHLDSGRRWIRYLGVGLESGAQFLRVIDIPSYYEYWDQWDNLQIWAVTISYGVEG